MAAQNEVMSDDVVKLFDEVIALVDERFGAGYARDNPTMVAALLQAAMIDRRGASIGGTLSAIARGL